jgi:hypothetical protein
MARVHLGAFLDRCPIPFLGVYSGARGGLDSGESIHSSPEISDQRAVTGRDIEPIVALPGRPAIIRAPVGNQTSDREHEVMELHSANR